MTIEDITVQDVRQKIIFPRSYFPGIPFSSPLFLEGTTNGTLLRDSRNSVS